MFEVLSQLTKAPKPTRKEFEEFFSRQQQSNSKAIHIIGLERKTDKIIAMGSVILVNTVLQGKLGKIENIVTCKSVRGKGLGKIIIEVLKDECWREQCNVIGLYCETHNVKFYEKLGFKSEGIIKVCYK